MSQSTTDHTLPGPFASLLGTWSVQRHTDDGNGAQRLLEGEVVFVSRFNGSAVQDLWTVPLSDSWCDLQPEGGFRGTTIYHFDDRPNVVQSVWIDPDHNTTLQFSGEMDPAGFTLTSIHSSIHARWHLHLTSESTATWHAYRSDSPDGPWKLWEIMQLTRLENSAQSNTVNPNTRTGNLSATTNQN